jgi:hypothetical protein
MMQRASLGYAWERLPRQNSSQDSCIFLSCMILPVCASTRMLLYRQGKQGAAVLHTVYQYNHQSGSLHLPLADGTVTPVAIKVCLCAPLCSCPLLSGQSFGLLWNQQSR